MFVAREQWFVIEMASADKPELSVPRSHLSSRKLKNKGENHECARHRGIASQHKQHGDSVELGNSARIQGSR